MQPQKWPIKSSRSIFSTSIVSLNANLSVNPRNGVENEYYVADFPDWANVIALTPEKEIVLIRHFRHGTKKLEVEIPGGCVEKGENPLAGAIRELREETGYIGKDPVFIGSVTPNPSFQGNQCYTYLLENVHLGAEQELDDGEDIEVFTLPLSKIDSLIENGELSNSMVIAALYFLKKHGLQF
jgi:ADP-ribose pyrophosphatase